jgi:nicotinate-nucleotide adenylyltransferase
LGGTFDPIHHGHLRVALDVVDELGFAEVRLLPSRQPPHRATPGATPSQRLAMLGEAIGDQPGLSIDRRELDRSGPSYMLDTLKSLRVELPNTPLCLLIGRDAFNELPTWYCWRELFDQTHFLVLERPGHLPSMSTELHAELQGRRVTRPDQLQQQRAGLVLTWQATQLAISATRIRGMIAGGYSPRYLLPDPVIHYIHAHKLYQQP